MRLCSPVSPKLTSGRAPAQPLLASQARAAASAAANSSGVLRLAKGSGPWPGENATCAACSPSRTVRGEARPAPAPPRPAPAPRPASSANIGSSPVGGDGDGGGRARAHRRHQPRDEVERQERRVAGRGRKIGEAVPGRAGERRSHAGERPRAAPSRRIRATSGAPKRAYSSPLRIEIDGAGLGPQAAEHAHDQRLAQERHQRLRPPHARRRPARQRDRRDLCLFFRHSSSALAPQSRDLYISRACVLGRDADEDRMGYGRRRFLAGLGAAAAAGVAAPALAESAPDVDMARDVELQPFARSHLRRRRHARQGAFRPHRRPFQAEYLAGRRDRAGGRGARRRRLRARRTPPTPRSTTPGARTRASSSRPRRPSA